MTTASLDGHARIREKRSYFPRRMLTTEVTIRFILPLITLSLFAFAPAPVYKPNPEREDLKAMQGEWRTTSMKVALPKGEIVEGILQTTLVKIRGSRMVGFLSATDPFEIVLNAKTTPRRIDVVRIQDGKKYRMRGVYRVLGDTLTINWGDDARPAGLSDIKPGGFRLVYKLKNP